MYDENLSRLNTVPVLYESTSRNPLNIVLALKQITISRWRCLYTNILLKIYEVDKTNIVKYNPLADNIKTNSHNLYTTYLLN